MPTIDDVARAAGVSLSTVSYVLSGKRPISEPTRERVKRAIVELGYRPHAGARALASNHTDVIGLQAPLRTGVDVNVIMQFVAGVVTRARENELDVLLLTQDDVGGIERVSDGSMVDAVIAMDVEDDDARIPSLLAMRQPAVLIGVPGRAEGLSCVDLDFEEAGRLALGHLTALGHRRVALIGPPRSVLARHTSYADRMLRGYRAQAAADGVEALVETCEGTAVGAREATAAVLARMPDVSAVVVHNESALPAVIAALRASGRRIPQDVSLLAVCPTDVALSQSIAVTSIDVPGRQIGAAAVDMVLERLGGGGEAGIHLVAPTVTERESTAPPGQP